MSYSGPLFGSLKDPLRLVLVGLQGVGKSATGNTILGREEFLSEVSSTCVTLKSESKEGQVCGRQVTVVDTPGLFGSSLSEAELKCELETALALCHPGPHVFLFIVQLGRFTEQEKAMAEKLKKLLVSDMMSHSIVLFTYGDRLKTKTIEQFVKEDKNLQTLIRQCGGWYHVFSNTVARNQGQVSELLDKVDGQVKSRPRHPHFVKERSYSGSPYGSLKDPLRLVLVGPQGLGKSATGNTILGREEFLSKMSLKSVTLKSESKEGQVCGRKVTVVDTPGLFGSTLSEAELKCELETALALCDPGPHVFLFIVQLGRFTEQEKAMLEKLKKLLDSDVMLHSMVLFTFSDRLWNKTIEQFVKEDKNVQSLIRKCEGWYHSFNNTVARNQGQVSELLDKVDCQVKARPKHPHFVKGLKIGFQNLRLVLVGLQGVGKSATGNTILGREEFLSEISCSCVTLKSESREGQVCGRQVTVVDTPGLFGTSLSDAELKRELETALALCAPGPHVFLFIVQLGRFTEQEKAMVEKLKELLDSDVTPHSIVLFTYGDKLKKKTIEQFVKEDKNLYTLIRKCGGWYHVFSNTGAQNQEQVRQLLSKVDHQVKSRPRHPYFVKGEKKEKKRSWIFFS